MKDAKFINTAELPDHEIEALARCFLPYIREYYETGEGREAFEEWERAREPEKPETPDTE
jgi:hypothetical protein